MADQSHHHHNIPPPISSLDQQHHPNSLIDMFHPIPSPNRFIRSDFGISVVHERDDINSNEFDLGFESFDTGSGSALGLGFLFENCDDDDDDDNLGFIVADSGDDFVPLNRITDSRDARSDSGDSLRVTDIDFDSDEAGDNESINLVDADSGSGFDEQEASFHLCWDAFHLQDEITNPNEDFEWEEVNNRINESEALGMFFGEEDDLDASVLPAFEQQQQQQSETQHNAASEWQVLSNIHNFDNFDPPDAAEDQYDHYDESNYTEYEMFFGQFGDSDAAPAASYGRPPASKIALANLSTVVVTVEDGLNNNVVCAVCKDEVVVGELATRLPCSHGYHGECILPWLDIRNTCPVCRYELPTDDVDYERRKVERGAVA